MRYRRLAGIAALFTGALGSSAIAADDPPREAEAAQSQTQTRRVEPVRGNWQGFYFGGHVGGATGTTTFYSPYGSDLFGGSTTTPAFLAGLQVGYNWLPMPQLLLGLEASGSYLTSQGQNTCMQPNTEQIGSTCQAFPNAIATFTGRVGYVTEPNGRTLIYGKAGAAWMHSQLYANPNSASFPDFNLGAETGDSASQAVGVWGWTIGAGVEYAFAPKWSLNLGYDYMRFTGISMQTPPTTSVSQAGEVSSVAGGTATVTQDMHIARIGLNYHWGGPSRTSSDSSDASPAGTAWVPGWETEVGLRYWYSSGNFQTTNSQSNTPNSPAGSNLSYNGMTGHSGEIFGRIDSPYNVFFKGFVGAGGITNGSMYDEDWGLGKELAGANPIGYALTQSNIGGSLSYLTADVGYNVLRGPDHKIGLFVGYNRYQMSLNTTGLTDLVNNGGATTPGNVLGISDNSTWQSLRLGLSAQVWPRQRFRVDADLAYLPYVSLNGMDSHWLRSAYFPVNGTGNGVQGELILSYYVTDAFSVGVGGRYWSMWTNSATYSFGGYEYVTQSANRYGVFLQGAYRFGSPKQ